MRILALGFISILNFIIIFINIKLYSDDFSKEEKIKDIILQLNFLERELKENNLGERMQNIFQRA